MRNMFRLLRSLATSRYAIPTFIILALGVAGWRVYAHYTDPVRIRNLAQDYIRRFVTSPVSIASAELITLGRLRLSDVRIDLPPTPAANADDDAADESQAVVACQAVELTFSALGAIFGDPGVESVVITRPTIVLAEGVLRRTLRTDALRERQAQGDLAALRLPSIELRDASLSVAIDDREASLPAEQRYLRFDDVDGTLWFGPEGGDYHLTGAFHGAACDVTGQFVAGEASQEEPGAWGFEIHADIRGLALPSNDEEVSKAQARFIQGVPAVAKLYRDYDPSGSIDVQLSVVKKPGADKPIDLPSLRVTLRDGTATCRYFPYRGTEVSGVVEYTPLGLRVNQLRARHGNGSFTVNAWVDGLPGNRSTRVEIEGSDIKIDEDLYAALPERYKKVFDQFSPAGICDVAVTLARSETAPGVWNRWRTSVRADLYDVTSAYDRFPYALEALNGSLVIEKGTFTLDNLRGRHGEATITINGNGAYAGNGITDLNLVVTVNEATVDESLLAALPVAVETRRMVESFDPRGTFDARALLTWDRAVDRLLYSVEVSPRTLQITHPKFPVRLDCYDGLVRITREKLDLDNVAARHDEAELRINGVYHLDESSSGTRIDISTRRLRLDQDIIAALPARTQRALEDWKIDGPISVETTILGVAGDQDARYRTNHVVDLKDATVFHAALPQPFTEVSARVTIDEHTVHARSVVARYGRADVRLDLKVVNTGDEGREVVASGVATDLPLDDSLWSVLPTRARAVIDALQPTGTADINIAELRYQKRDESAAPTCSVRGAATLRGVNLARGVDLKDADLAVTFAGKPVDSRAGCLMDGKLQASEAKLFQHPVTDLSGRWTLAVASDGTSHLALKDLAGALHGGVVTGDVEVISHNGDITYDVRTMIDDVDVAALMSAYRDEDLSNGKPANVRGRVAARLDLSGTIGDVNTRRGTGHVMITEAHMFRLPVLLKILHVINLTVPDDSAFRYAEANFLAMGNKLEFDRILLHGRALALVGNGSADLLSKRLDLHLATVSPHRWAKVPLLTEFLEAASGELIELHVTGALSDPEVKQVPLRALKGLFETLIQKKKRAPIAPAP